MISFTLQIWNVLDRKDWRKEETEVIWPDKWPEQDVSNSYSLFH